MSKTVVGSLSSTSNQHCDSLQPNLVHVETTGHRHVNIFDRAFWLCVVGPLSAASLAVATWAVSLRYVNLSHMTDLGLLTVLPISTYFAFGLLTISFCWVAYQSKPYIAVLLIHVIVLIVMIHGMPNILYGSLRYSWAWKHVGIVDYIQRHGAVNPSISVPGAELLRIYHNWPGFFALSALVTEAAGFNSSLSFARWSQVAFNLLDLGALLFIFQSLTRDHRLVWLSTWFFFVTNWIGQDYFSPQALSYFLYLIVLGICLYGFSDAKPPLLKMLKRRLPAESAVRVIHKVLSRTDASSSTRSNITRSGQQIGLMLIMIAAMMAIASSHQLTPFITISALALLAIFQRCSARYLPILMAVLTLSWIIYMAAPYVSSNPKFFRSLLSPLAANINETLIDLSLASTGQVIVAVIGRGLTAFVWILAILGGIRRLRQGLWDLTAALLVFAPFLLLASQSYGGEMLFRFYFFSLPFIVFFAAALIYPSPVSGVSKPAAALSAALSIVLFAGFCFAYYGKEQMYYFSQDEIAAAEYVHDVAPPNSLVMDATWDWPLHYKNYEFYSYFSLSRLSHEDHLRLLDDPVPHIIDLMTSRNPPAAYFIITRSQKADIDTRGVMPPGSLDLIEQALIHSERFSVVFRRPDAIVFSLVYGAQGAGK